MSISNINLDSINNLRKDSTGLSTAYFSTSHDFSINKQLINALKVSAQQEKQDLRICLHADPEETLHNMIILQHSTTLSHPHLHPSQSESYQIIEGKIAIVHFSEAGGIEKVKFLDSENDFIYRIGNKQFHMLFPLTDIAIFHESRPGPFNRSQDCLSFPWFEKLTNQAKEQFVIDTRLKILKNIEKYG